MRWVCNKEQHEYMRLRQKQNRSKTVCSEEWAWKSLRGTGHKWTRQAMWGCRLFDFWCAELGIAVEIDGAEHRQGYDAYRDKYNFHRSAILVIRVRNYNEADLNEALSAIRSACTWQERRVEVRRFYRLADDAPMKNVLKAAGIEKAHYNWRPPQVTP